MNKVLQEITVEEVMTENVITIKMEEAITKAADKMLKSKIHGLVTVDKSRPAGIISTFDLLKIVFMKEYRDSVPVKTFASKQELITVSPDDTLEAAALLMVDNNIRTLPVVSGEKLVGIVSMMDIMRKIIP